MANDYDYGWIGHWNQIYQIYKLNKNQSEILTTELMRFYGFIFSFQFFFFFTFAFEYISLLKWFMWFTAIEIYILFFFLYKPYMCRNNWIFHLGWHFSRIFRATNNFFFLDFSFAMKLCVWCLLHFRVKWRWLDVVAVVFVKMVWNTQLDVFLHPNRQALCGDNKLLCETIFS